MKYFKGFTVPYSSQFSLCGKIQMNYPAYSIRVLLKCTILLKRSVFSSGNESAKKIFLISIAEF